MAKLFFYYSAMNAGKTTTLLQSDYNYRERGMRTLLLTTSLDSRSGRGMIRSRIGLNREAVIYDKTSNLKSIIAGYSEDDPLHCVLVDEAQFLEANQVMQLCAVVDHMKIPVLCYGIRTDFQGHLFPGSQALLAHADTLIELKTICECARKATMNARLDTNQQMVLDGDQVGIGGNDTYKALCRKCFVEKRLAQAKSLNNDIQEMSCYNS